MTDEERIAELIIRRLEETLSPSEEEELEAWIDADPENRLYMATRVRPEFILETLQALCTIDEEELDRKAWDRIDQVMLEMWRRRRGIQRCRKVFILGAFLLVTRVFGQSDYLPCRDAILKHQVQNITEPVQRPTLTTSTNRQLFLDTLVDGRLGWLGNCLIFKRSHDQIAFVRMKKIRAISITPGSLYVTVSIPIGVNTLQISLPDGSQVYMDGGSSLTYCLQSSGGIAGQRIAALDGQASFKIAHDSLLFVLETSRAEMLVYGTSFLVRDFHKEDTSAIYQYTDRMEVSNGRGRRTLYPFQRAMIDPSFASIRVVATGDSLPNPVFRRQDFDFTHQTLRGALNELAKWYGIRSVHVDPALGADTVRPLSLGLISKDLSLDNLIEKLQTDKMHFTANEDVISATK